MTRPHVSPSQLNTYLRCPEAWRRRYIENEIIPPGFAAHAGSGVHEAAQENFTQKIDSHADMKPSDFLDRAVAAFEASINESGVRAEDGVDVDKQHGWAVDRTAALALQHASEIAPQYQPKVVEHEFRIELPKLTHDIIGFIDLVDDQDRLVDFKTTGRAKSQREADESLQLTTYAAAMHREGIAASDIVLDVSVFKAKTQEVTHQTFSTQRGPADYQRLASTIQAVVGGINAGSFPPAAPGVWWCSERFCGYAKTCPFFKKP